MKYSLLLPIGPTRPEQVVPFANLVQWTAADRLWLGQGMVLESQHLVSWLAGLGIRVPTGFGVSLMPFRSPYHAAVEARSVAIATGRPVVAGFGPGAVALQRGLLGRPYTSQIGAAKEYVRIVRDLVAGRTAETEGGHFTVSAALIPALAPPVSVGLGALRERMAVAAGEVADAAVTWMAGARYLADTLVPAMRGADRELAAPLRVSAIVPFALAAPGRDPVALASAACGSHIQLPHYQDTLRRAGVVVRGQADEDARALVDAGVFLYGSADEIHGALKEFAAAGVDEVVLNATGVGLTHGPKAAADDLLALLRGVARDAESGDGGLR
ncbi:LLM class flavin-dependent oxidoreductase [Streptomyces castrisilvae]|uniref:LLM class flavin-dependent oxidoreductase n=1 Tax=Streptomyces castrisilvae TaxID=3033811 RepID=A0ABY9HIU4_9ACTN|nr:LLM class flavin-dependent oxidoreductase [Streptomyces sp. Mut1]WLQ34211.1 LLM class flavin-dependent oxidoreductase [Streptomyces sp. Mut1]